MIGRNRNQTFHLLVTGKLPATKVGDSWVAMPSELLRVCGKSSAAAACKAAKTPNPSHLN